MKIVIILGMLFSCSLLYASDTEISDREGNRLSITGAGKAEVKTDSTNSTLGSGYRDVPVVNIPIRVSGDVAINRIVIKASSGNSEDIYIGGTDVSTTSGIYLDAGEEWTGTVDNLNNIWINATATGDSVGFIYEQR